MKTIVNKQELQDLLDNDKFIVWIIWGANPTSKEYNDPSTKFVISGYWK